MKKLWLALWVCAALLPRAAALLAVEDVGLGHIGVARLGQHLSTLSWMSSTAMRLSRILGSKSAVTRRASMSITLG